MSTLKERLVADMKTAMREKDSELLETIRMLRAAIQRKEVDEQVDLDDARVQAVIQKQIKQAKDSIDQFGMGGREDLVAKEARSLEVMVQYMPEPLSKDELAALVNQALEETGADSIRDMGKVMSWLKPKVEGRADMGRLSQTIKNALNT